MGIKVAKFGGSSVADAIQIRKLRDIVKADEAITHGGIAADLRFGHDEANVFRFLFQTNAFGGQDLTALVAAPEVRELVGVVAQEAGVDVARARQVFLAIFVAAHGYASLLANNALEYDETQVTDVLLAAYAGALQMEGR